MWSSRLESLAVLAALLAAAPARADDGALIAAVRDAPAGALAAGLPTAALGDWLRRELPRGALMLWQTSECGEGPPCVGLRLELPSRDRVVDLLFAVDPPAFVAGVMDSPSAAAPRSLSKLDDLLPALDRPLVLLRLACPDGAEARLATDYAGAIESCRRGEVADGPYRSWFQTGLYLMAKGTWREGLRVGPWIVCDRFEQCERVIHDDAGIEVSRRAIGGSP